jgi:predicted phage terminase large subunit-like protein
MKIFKTTPRQKKVIREIVSNYFKDKKGKPFQLTDGQCDLFGAIVKREMHYVWCSAPSRYGKTEVCALALIYLAVIKHFKIPIVGGSEEKAKKIMEYILQHLPDHPELYAGLINLAGVNDIKKLQIQASKNVLRWATGGWIYITSIEARQVSKEGEKVVGEGGDVVILEEAGLIRSKEQYSKVVRMAEGDYRKLVMLGNCIEKSVFENAFNDDLYVKVHIKLEQALKEGRFTQEELDEKKTQTTSRDWKRYYEVEFPEGSQFNYFKPKTYEFLPTMKEIYGAVDLALGESKKGSLVGITVTGKDENGQFYELESIGEHLTPDETIVRIMNLPYTFNRFGVETVQFQKYFFQVIERKSKEMGKYIPFERIEQSKKKEIRIESLEPPINTGQILFKGSGVLWEHMSDYPNCQLDVLDSLEMNARISGLKSDKPRFSFEVL